MLAPHRKYKSALFKVVQDVDQALYNLSKSKKTWGVKHLWKVSEADSARLTRLFVWSERYGLSLEYILEVLLSYYYAHLPNLARTKARISKGLGVRIATLVGDTSLDILRESCDSDFPDGSNLSAFKETEKERIADLLDPDDLPSKPRNVLQFKTISSFVSAYERKTETRRKGVLRVEHKMRKIAWRNNPWR